MSLGLLTATLRTVKNVADDRVEQVYGLVTAKLIDDSGDWAHIQARKTRAQFVRLSAAVCGIEFCYAAETAFVSPTLLKIGVHVAYMSLIWCLSPLLGFLLVPLLGSLSDRCRWRLGRRRPFILMLSCGILLGLVLVPNGQSIGIALGDKYYHAYVQQWQSPGNTSGFGGNFTAGNVGTDSQNVAPHRSLESHVWSVVFTVIGVVLLDLNCDACQSPCRAYLLDVCTPADHPLGLSYFTVMAGAGGAIGYVIGAINWEGTSLTDTFSSHITVVFTLVFFIYVFCLALTVTAIKEVPLDKLNVSAQTFQKQRKLKGSGDYQKFTNDDDVSYGSTDSEQQMNCDEEAGNKKPTSEKNESLSIAHEISLNTYLRSIVRLPRALVILCLTNLFCWMSLVCYSLYFTDFVGQAVYEGDPRAPVGSKRHNLYEEGVRMGSLGMSLYSISCSIYSLSIEKLVQIYGAKRVYMLSQLVYTAGMFVMSLWRGRAAVLLLSPTAGIMYATLFTMPYILIAHYHNINQFSQHGPEAEPRGLGTDIALVSSMVFVAQLLLSLVMGSMQHYFNSTVVVTVAACFLSAVGALLSTQVLYFDL